MGPRLPKHLGEAAAPAGNGGDILKVHARQRAQLLQRGLRLLSPRGFLQVFDKVLGMLNHWVNMALVYLMHHNIYMYIYSIYIYVWYIHIILSICLLCTLTE